MDEHEGMTDAGIDAYGIRSELRLIDDRGVIATVHSRRFRKVSNLYPRMVAMAYNRDLDAAALDDDVTVAARVAAYEGAQGWERCDWVAIGRDEEGRGEDEG